MIDYGIEPNSGELQIFIALYVDPSYGDWFDAQEDPDALHEAAQRIVAMWLKENPGNIAEEYFVSDYIGWPQGFEVETSDLKALNELANVLAMIDDEEQREAFLAYVADMGDDPLKDPAASYARFEDAFRGIYDSSEDYAQELFEDIYDIPSYLQNYIDWEKVARDMEMGGDLSFHKVGYRVAVWSNG